ncbi:MAG: FecR domain-containing protein [Candidatus Firestonebacteria bacterium]|nr:FecR domain-containing protein [Candidatus Firestonebacteria bacterium]
MRKKMWLGGMLVMLSLVLGGAAAAVAATSESAANAGVGTLTVKIGRVEIQRSGQAVYAPAEKGGLIYEGDKIKTGELARAAILLDDGSLIRLNANSELLVKDKKPGKQKSRLQLMLGQLWAKVTKQENSLEIETPSAVAAIKGTQLELIFTPDGKTVLIVWDGLVNLSNALGRLLVHAGEQGTAGKNGAPVVIPVDLKSLDQWFETVVEVPATQTLKTTVKDKNGKEQTLDLKYNKK